MPPFRHLAEFDQPHLGLQFPERGVSIVRVLTDWHQWLSASNMP